MVAIPAGDFLMGTPLAEIQAWTAAYGYHQSWLDGELPQRQVYLPAYAIDQYPVTHRDYAEFCNATGYPARPNWPFGVPPPELLDHPVNHVTQADAIAYANWIGKRLPSEAEWEKAARGVQGLTFPWGDVFEPDRCQWNSDPSSIGLGTARVDAHRGGVSPFGVHDMVGNVGEWCCDGPSSYTAFIKGGAWTSSEILNLRPAARNMSGLAANPSRFVGFRCVRDFS
jgi:formylglycine-generating enzyme required for sulfatase activity